MFRPTNHATTTSTLALVTLLAAPAAAQDAAVAQTGNDWYLAGQGTLAEMLALQPNTGTARNVILFTADGNGVGTNYAIRLFAGQAAGGLGDDHVLPYETFSDIALVKTYSTNGQTPDSAPTATAMNTGAKTKNDMINIADGVAVDDCAAGLDPANQLTTFAEIMAGLGKSVGVVSTARITHATPAAVYGHTVNRDWENDSEIPEGCEQRDLAVQLIDALADGTIDLALGGGRAHFLPAEVTDDEGEAGARTDGRNLIEEFTAAGGQYAWDEAGFQALTAPGNAGVLGLFESSHMLYEHDREGEPSLEAMTRMAIGSLSGNEQGYYLSVEGGRVDHANHGGNLYRAVTDGVAFADAVAAAMELTDPADTLIIVTADHEHAIAFNGYCGRGSSIVGLCMEADPAGVEALDEPALASDGKPYTVAGYLNGAGSVLTEQADGSFFGTRPVVDEATAVDPDYLQQAMIPMSSETHSGEDVAVYARGPWSHLFGGTIEQNYIFHVMNHAVAPDAVPLSAPADDATEDATSTDGTTDAATEAPADGATDGSTDAAADTGTDGATEESTDAPADTTTTP